MLHWLNGRLDLVEQCWYLLGNNNILCYVILCYAMPYHLLWHNIPLYITFVLIQSNPTHSHLLTYLLLHPPPTSFFSSSSSSSSSPIVITTAILVVSLSFELFLALVSFFINIGLNLQIVFPSLDVVYGISIAAVLTLVMSMMGLKYAAYTSALGVCLTSLLLIALMVAGLQLPTTDIITNTITTTLTTTKHHKNHTSGSMEAISTMISPRQYELFVPSHLPMSLGLIAFCFGGR